MSFILLFLCLILLIYGPQWWVRRVLTGYQRRTASYQGCGGELARQLLDRAGLRDVGVESTQSGDHYDPQARAVRLGPDNLDTNSLTALVTAAHEVGHAIQHAQGHGPFQWRLSLVRMAQGAERLGSFLIFAMPLLALVSRSPALGALTLAAGVATAGLGVGVQVITLPVEWDASFGRALPILERGGYLGPGEQRAARRILRACALTYLAASLAGLLNFWRWLAILRR